MDESAHKKVKRKFESILYRVENLLYCRLKTRKEDTRTTLGSSALCTGQTQYS